MEEIKPVNIVFIGRGDMLQQLCGVKHDSKFVVSSVQFLGLLPKTSDVKLFSDAESSLKATISKADKVFILSATGDKSEVRDYLIQIKLFLLSDALGKFVVMGPKKLVDNKASVVGLPSLHQAGLRKGMLEKIPFIDSTPSEGKFNSELLKLYPQDTRELIQQRYEGFLADQERQRDERTSPSREYARRNPYAILIEMQEAIKASTAAVVDLAERIKASDDKGFVDRKIQKLEGLKKQFEEKVKEYTQRISQTDGELRAQLEAFSSEQVGKVDSAKSAAISAQKVLDDRIAEAERIERERIDSIEDYVASVNFAEETQNSDVVCVVFDPTLPNCENDLREGVERIKAAHERNPSVRAVFLRAKPYSIQQDLGFEDLQAHPEKDSDAKMIKGLGIVDPVIVDNLPDFKNKAGYGQPVVFRKVQPDVERLDLGGVLEPEAIPEQGNVVVAAAEKPKPALNPNRFSFSGIKHSRYERKKLLENNKNLNWLELNKLSVEKRCDTSRLIKQIAGVQLKLVDRVKVDQARYKVVIDLLKFLDKEERRLKPKVKTFFAKFATDEYIVKREAQRKLIYGVAAAIFTELENNAVPLTSDKLNEILRIQLKVYLNDGHVRRGILRIIGDNFPDLRDQIRFPQAIPVPEAVEVERVAPQAASLVK